MSNFSWFIVVFLFLSSCKSLSGYYDVTDFGAKNDSTKLSTKAIQKAIDKANANGGGKVVFPPGVYLTGTIVLKDNVTLYFNEGSRLKGSDKHADYLFHKTKISVYPNPNRAYLIYADGVKNISIEGKGVIDGNGTKFWEPFDTLPRWIKPLNGRVSNMIEINNSKNIVIKGVTLSNSPEWTCHLFDCDDVLVEGIRLVNNLYGPNNDGIDISGCNNVMIANSYIETCDDAVCIKTFPSSRESSNITVTNCIMKTTCVALKLGENFKRIADVTFSNCIIYESSRAIGIYGDCGGTTENINISNIVCNTNAPLILNRPIQIGIWKGKGNPGKIRNISISNFTATTEGRIMLTAIEGSLIENITLRDVNLVYPMIEDPSKYAEGTTSNQFSSIDIDAKKAKAAIVAQNVNGLVIHNLNITWPHDTIPTQWKFVERIENGSNRVHRPDYATPKATEFSIVWAKNVDSGYIYAPLAKPSAHNVKDYLLINSNIKIKQTDTIRYDEKPL